MRTASRKRAENKQQSRERVLDAAARRIRQEGLAGTAIASVMADAGLTHGAFYAHFDSKDDLDVAAFSHAVDEWREKWVPIRRSGRWDRRLTSIAKRYLTSDHRDDVANGCGYPALVSEATHAGPAFRVAFEQELLRSVEVICGDDANDASHRADALALMVICVGGLALSRAVDDDDLSTQILRAARRAASQLAEATITTAAASR
ncbi:TetR/AcrR family transcriptional regulator [Mycobacterium interjectum]|uniref:TetR/AcrR family transcriptional regulator n=1 Tax=Mycobacterium interjectum TaxID=33895 RepID=UPI0009FDE3E9|nr:TetR/AcrR family transcriptional regulator [Mycobacterium interjectum]MCV7090117.1 TetR/AcrR family transcriptional regulator [Mycobacterium interjectum]